jgi:hypothetical protein
MALCLVKRHRQVQLVSGGYTADRIMHANLSAAASALQPGADRSVNEGKALTNDLADLRP